MIFSTKTIIDFPDLKLGVRTLTRATNFKYLGLILDSSLKHHEHLNALRSKMAQLAGVSFKLKDHFTLTTSTTFYYTMVQAHIAYGIEVWGGALLNSTLYNDLQTIQDRIVRNQFGSKLPGSTTNEIYKQLKILKVAQLYQFSLAKLMFKTLKLGRAQFLQEDIAAIQVKHHHQTRSRNSLRAPFAFSNVTKSNFLYQGIHLWNTLPDAIQNSQSLVQFKKHMKEYYINS